MEHRQRLRNIGILCCHFLRNLAFYRSGWRNGQLVFREQFWINVNSNFLDIAVLEWCKLFADNKSKHHWRKVVTDPNAYFNGLLDAVEMDDVNFENYIIEMRIYRDKFIAHLDEMPRMDIPKLEIAKKSIIYLYDYLIANEEENGCFKDAPRSGADFYRQFKKRGHQVYS
ncbi:MAG: hypothetical protein ACXV8O_19650 [Methylobacter sp.]